MKKMQVPALTGQTIKRVRAMTKKECEAQGWSIGMDGAPLVIELDSGVRLFASQDPEGNGPGAMFGEFEGTGFYVAPERR